MAAPRPVIAALRDSGVGFVAVDNPHANKLTVHILAAVAVAVVLVSRPCLCVS
jgi:hypothetical protein